MSKGYDLQWFQVMTFRKTRFVLYGEGQWEDHIMDWQGCNYWHGRIPESPVFDSVDQAVEWARSAVAEGKLERGMILPGHHSGVQLCSKGCSAREAKAVYFADLVKA